MSYFYLALSTTYLIFILQFEKNEEENLFFKHFLSFHLSIVDSASSFSKSYPFLKNKLWFLIKPYYVYSTLRSRIAEHARLFINRKKSILLMLIRACSLINFPQKTLPARLLGPARLFVFLVEIQPARLSDSRTKLHSRMLRFDGIFLINISGTRLLAYRHVQFQKMSVQTFFNHSTRGKSLL